MTIVHCGLSSHLLAIYGVFGALSKRRANPIIISYLRMLRSARRVSGVREIVVQLIRVGSVPGVCKVT